MGISGGVIISDNTDDNVYLASNTTKLDVKGELESAGVCSAIGITYYTSVNETGSAVTSNYLSYYTTAYVDEKYHSTS